MCVGAGGDRLPGGRRGHLGPCKGLCDFRSFVFNKLSRRRGACIDILEVKCVHFVGKGQVG